MLSFDDLGHYRQLGLPAWVHDPVQHCHLWANDAAVRFWCAASLDELLGRSYSDISRGALSRLEVAMQAHRRGETTREHWTLYPGGRPTSVVLHGSGVRLPDGREAILFVAEAPTSHDPDLLRTAETLLHLPVMVAVHRAADGVALMRNAAAVLMLGPLEGGPRFDELFDDPAQARVLRGDGVAGRPSHGEARLRTRHGVSWFAVDVHPGWDPASGERVLHLCARDISELKSAQVQLEEARIRAEAANAAKTAFLAHMSHELRTPLHGVLGMLQLSLRSASDERQRKWLQVAQSSGQLLLQLLNDLLDLSRIEAGRLELEQTVIDLAELVRQTVEPLRAEAEAKGVALHLALGPVEGRRYTGDAVRIRQVLFNVIGNAVKFTDKGQVHLKVVPRPLEGGVVELAFEVTDTGIGIDPAQAERLFEPFTQADSGVARRFGGSGLGLSIVRRLVDLMGGEVVLRGSPGQGTTVSWTLRLLTA